MLKSVTDRLLPEAKIWWRLASSRFQMIVAGIITAVLANPDILVPVVTILPDGPLRIVTALLVGLGYFTGDRLIRLWRERRLPRVEDLAGSEPDQ